jgi:polyribonucleotide nucleotidyltransferase
MIRKITEETKTTIDIQDDGTVNIGSNNAENTQKAVDWIKSLTREVEAGEIYTGKVTRILPFGAFIEILPGKEGLVHISELANYRVPTVEDVVKIGDEIQVLVTEIDRQGRINLSRRALLEPAEDGSEEGAGEGAEPGRNGDSGEGDRRRSFGERRGREGDRGGRGGGGGGGGFRDRDRDRGPRREGGGGGGGGGFRDRERPRDAAEAPSGASATRERPPRRDSDRPRGSATGRRASMRQPTGDSDAAE